MPAVQRTVTRNDKSRNDKTRDDKTGDERPASFFRLETWLVLTSVSLVFQLFPALFWGLLYAVDVRNWTWGVWVGIQVAVVAILIFLKVRHDEPT